MKNLRYIVDVITASDTTFLSTLNLEKFPETRAMSNCLNKAVDEKLDLYFAYHTNSSKGDQIKNNSNGSLYYILMDDMRHVTLFGIFQEILDKSIKDKMWREELEPYYRNGKDDALYGLLKFVPKAYKYYVITSGKFEAVNGVFDF